MFQNKPLGSLISSHVGGGTPSRQVADFWNGNIPWASVKDFSDNNGKLERTEEHITAQGLNSSSSSLIKENTIVICSRMAVGKAALTKIPVAINQDLKALFNKKNVNERYLLKLLQWLAVKIESKAVGSTVKGIRISDLLALETPVAPETEQPIIADVLDNLDTKIIQTELLIKKMQLVKEGLLNDLLTRGIGVDGQLRPSFQQAPHLYKKSPLGWIPKEWHTGELDNALNNIEAGKSPSCPDIPAHTGEWGVLKVSAVHPDGFRAHENKLVEQTELQDQRYEVKSGDLLITRANTPELVGLPCLVHTDRERLMLSDKTLRLHVKEGYEKAFIFISLTQPYVRSQIQIAATGTSMSMKNISQNSLKRLNMKFPPHAEQVLIAERILDAGRRISEENALLKKMEQQKAGLMDDLLTGKVRVTELLNHQPPAQ